MKNDKKNNPSNKDANKKVELDVEKEQPVKPTIRRKFGLSENAKVLME